MWPRMAGWSVFKNHSHINRDCEVSSTFSIESWLIPLPHSTMTTMLTPLYLYAYIINIFDCVDTHTYRDVCVCVCVCVCVLVSWFVWF